MKDSIKISELRKGDIILYEAVKGDTLDDLIVKVTGSIVTHTAMMDHADENGYSYVVEETLPTAQVTVVNDPKEAKGSQKNRVGRPAHVLRMKQAEKEGYPDVVSRAEWYTEEPALPFAMNSFLFTLVYMLFNKNFAGTKYYKIIMDLVGLAMMEMDGWANGKSEKGYPMVCSQFAYHCYKEMNHPIELSVDRTCNLFEDLLKALDGDLDKKLSDYINSMKVSFKAPRKEKLDAEKEAKGILLEIQQVEKKEEVNQIEFFASDNSWIAELIQFLIKLAGSLIKNFNPDDFTIRHFLELMNSTMYDYFVSPGDIFNAQNLEHIGMLDYEEE